MSCWLLLKYYFSYDSSISTFESVHLVPKEDDVARALKHVLDKKQKREALYHWMASTRRRSLAAKHIQKAYKTHLMNMVVRLMRLTSTYDVPRRAAGT